MDNVTVQRAITDASTMQARSQSPLLTVLTTSGTKFTGRVTGNNALHIVLTVDKDIVFVALSHIEAITI